MTGLTIVSVVMVIMAAVMSSKNNNGTSFGSKTSGLFGN